MADRFVELNTTGWVADHREKYLADGEAGHLWDSTSVGGPGVLPTLLLTTVGCRSGKTRVMPLLYIEVPGGYAIIASRGGDARHPGWYHNLVANDTVGVQVASSTYSAKARVAQGGERAQIWQQMEAMYPPYAGYAAKAAPREIPVVVLETNASA